MESRSYVRYKLYRIINTVYFWLKSSRPGQQQTDGPKKIFSICFLYFPIQLWKNPFKYQIRRKADYEIPLLQNKNGNWTNISDDSEIGDK